MITGLWPPLNSLLLKHMIDTMSYTEPDNVLSLIFWPAVFFVLNFEIHNLCWRGVGYSMDTRADKGKIWTLCRWEKINR